MADTEREDPEGAIRHWDDAMERDAQRWRKYIEWLRLDRQGKPTPLDGLSDYTAVDELTAALDKDIGNG